MLERRQCPTPVSPHGLNIRERLDDVLAMAVSGETLYAAGYRTGPSAHEAELWRAAIGDERWSLVRRITGMRRPETMAVHGGTDEGGIVYVGGTSIDNSAILVRFHKIHGTQVLALPVRGGRVLISLLTMGPYLFATIDRGALDARDATIWRTSRPNDPGAWVRISPEISADRPHIHSIKLGRGRSNEILAGTARATPGGVGDPGTGAEVWRGTEDGSSWERLAANGFGDPNTGAIPALHEFRDIWGGTSIYVSTQNHRAGSTIYKRYSGERSGTVPYDADGAPIRSMATFERRLFIAEGNNPKGARLFYTMSGDRWTQDSAIGRPYDFAGSGGEVPLGLHALTSAYSSTEESCRRFLYLAAQYEGAGVRIWRRTLNLWDSVIDTVIGAWDARLPTTFVELGARDATNGVLVGTNTARLLILDCRQYGTFVR